MVSAKTLREFMTQALDFEFDSIRFDVFHISIVVSKEQSGYATVKTEFRVLTLCP